MALERQIQCAALFHALEEGLSWRCLHLPDPFCVLAADHSVDAQDLASGAALVGFLNFIRPHPVQVAGRLELDYLRRLPEQIPQFLNERLRLLVLCEVEDIDAVLLERLRAQQIAVFAAPQRARAVLSRLQHFLHQELAPREFLHGVLVDVFGVGVLIQGEAGIGKSELALELVSRNHRLVADDSVLCVREAPEVITGHCPPALRDFLEVRGLGIINIRELFGAAAIVRSKRLRLVIEIKEMADMEMADIDRLQGKVDRLQILGVEFTRLRLPVSPARNLAVLVEAAARSQYVKESGIDMLAEFDAQTRLAAAGLP
ncbi:MAG: HPr(Ser) kinase/phosphatase [Acidithiobacillus sp.]|uniref:HPr(Ser) kinase/phosphatase n=1 Tax=Acidithiobacillus sp. TaxID=1872118 RepID=UPI0025C66AFC|nr:HPr(Ser) kinase/phosphatase [Acidithiobacillus sp.]